MDFPGPARQIPKKRRTSTTKSVVQLPDLNAPPAEANGAGISSSSMAVSHNQASTSVPPAANGPQIGIQSFPIDVEAIDDDVMICPSRSFPQTRRRSTRTERVIMILDDEPETNPEPAGDALDEHVNTLLSLGINRRHVPPRASNNSPVITLLDTPEVGTVRATTVQAAPAPVMEVPREPRFTCPVCLNELTEPSSTPCGHIFCKMCIKSAIQAQKKCPTCRRKLGNTSFHRVYLPTTTE
ncbi:hypothetical protein EJB05_17948 [Eragrostis curvula]|uniref:RING-type domain-containing protein n=1 Tax=Eragrostis curvula TaxID=38414 RepID=A0A5J9VJT5_9POAL|nr:hypothetical protein EJB05_17948 [Eragrostis curvula]